MCLCRHFRPPEPAKAPFTRTREWGCASVTARTLEGKVTSQHILGVIYRKTISEGNSQRNNIMPEFASVSTTFGNPLKCIHVGTALGYTSILPGSFHSPSCTPPYFPEVQKGTLTEGTLSEVRGRPSNQPQVSLKKVQKAHVLNTFFF